MDNKKLDEGSLAECLYDHRSLRDLERLLEHRSYGLLVRQWELTEEQCREQIQLAIEFIKKD